jgi:hypothetical protein
VLKKASVEEEEEEEEKEKKDKASAPRVARACDLTPG